MHGSALRLSAQYSADLGGLSVGLLVEMLGRGDWIGPIDQGIRLRGYRVHTRQ